MRRRTLILVLGLLPILSMGAVAASPGADVPPPKPREVQLGPDSITMPLGRILLLRRGKAYCAVKFLRFRDGETPEERHAEYEAYETPGETGAFAVPGTETVRREASITRPRGIGFLSFGAGKPEVRCGSFRLTWSGTGTVRFEGQGGKPSVPETELAPTYWKEVSNVNTGDFRIIWYVHDDRREKINVPIGDFALQ